MKTLNQYINEKLILKKNVIFDCDFVDLGLPSGTKWGTCNIGAKKEHEYGDYFAWGETETKEEYTWETYKFLNNNKITKYSNQDKLEELELEDDVAHKYCISDSCLPTDEQFRELKEYTTFKWQENYNDTGISGALLIGENGNSIFLPASGYKHDNIVKYNNKDGQYWSKNLYPDKQDSALGLEFNDKYTSICCTYRSCGYSIRPVLNK